MPRIDYDAWAQRYDETRGVSPSVLRPLLEALGPARGSLLDIGGGTGNYSVALSEAGFGVVHCDPSPGMAARAASKGIQATVCDGQRLPFVDGSFDAAAHACGIHDNLHVLESQHPNAPFREDARPDGASAQ